MWLGPLAAPSRCAVAGRELESSRLAQSTKAATSTTPAADAGARADLREYRNNCKITDGQHGSTTRVSTGK